MKLGAAIAVQLIERRKDGRGGVVEIPIVAETPLVDFSKTAGGGKTTGRVSVSDLREMADNFGSFPGPIPIGAGSHSRDIGGAAMGFIDKLTLRGDTLWARLDLGPGLFSEVVDHRAWRGFSIEAVKDLQKPTVKFDGWVLVGGVFTNQPALDVHFRLPESIAASVGEASNQRLINVAFKATTSDLERGQEKEMDEKAISLASHEAKVQEIKEKAASDTGELNGRLETATTQLTAVTQQVEKLRRSNSELDSALASAVIERDSLRAMKAETISSKDATIANLRSELNKTTLRLTEIEQESKENANKAMGADVRAVVADAINAGVPPAEFDGYDASPAVWLMANFASFEAFQAHCTRRKATVKLQPSGSTVPSGSDPNEDAETVKLTDAEKKVLEHLKLAAGPDYTGVADQHEAQKRLEAWKAKNA